MWVAGAGGLGAGACGWAWQGQGGAGRAWAHHRPSVLGTPCRSDTETMKGQGLAAGPELGRVTRSSKVQ